MIFLQNCVERPAQIYNKHNIKDNIKEFILRDFGGGRRRFLTNKFKAAVNRVPVLLTALAFIMNCALIQSFSGSHGKMGSTYHERNMRAELNGHSAGSRMDNLLCKGKYVSVGPDAFLNL